VTAAPDLVSERGRAIRIDAETARALGVEAGAVVELVNPRGAPLRAWVAGVTPGNGHRAAIAPAALRMLSLGDGAEVEIRAVHSGALGTR
jgi:anaerobic selenocysteine-containing dehydrogenase